MAAPDWRGLRSDLGPELGKDFAAIQHVLQCPECVHVVAPKAKTFDATEQGHKIEISFARPQFFFLSASETFETAVVMRFSYESRAAVESTRQERAGGGHGRPIRLHTFGALHEWIFCLQWRHMRDTRDTGGSNDDISEAICGL
jgi:hypothetical protein